MSSVCWNLRRGRATYRSSPFAEPPPGRTHAHSGLSGMPQPKREPTRCRSTFLVNFEREVEEDAELSVRLRPARLEDGVGALETSGLTICKTLSRDSRFSASSSLHLALSSRRKSCGSSHGKVQLRRCATPASLSARRSACRSCARFSIHPPHLWKRGLSGSASRSAS